MLIIVVYIFLSRRITNPIKKVVDNLKAVQYGDFTVRADSSWIVEIEELNEDFNKMVRRINDLLEDIRVSGARERDAELRVLQAQINPHFLYNTLDTIHWLSDNQEVAEIVNRLARFFRLSLSKGKNIVTLNDELEHVETYLRIQQIRLEDKFLFEKSVDETLLKCLVLKMILQPLVENALLHGLKNIRTGGIIRITCKKMDGKLQIDIMDNGEGVDLDKIDFILSGRSSSGYGIRNVNERLRLKYSTECSLQFFNNKWGGATVRLILPITIDEEAINYQI